MEQTFNKKYLNLEVTFRWEKISYIYICIHYKISFFLIGLQQLISETAVFLFCLFYAIYLINWEIC